MQKYLRVWAPFLVVAAGVPLAVGLVPPNSIYGLRTTRTKSSPDVWYKANHTAGLALVAAGCASAALNFLIAGKLGRRLNGTQLNLAYTGALLVPLAIAALVSFLATPPE
jgi:hypothetical protein